MWLHDTTSVCVCENLCVCVCVCPIFHFKVHWKASWLLEEWASRFLALCHLWFPHSAACRTYQCNNERQNTHTHSNALTHTWPPAREDKHTHTHGTYKWTSPESSLTFKRTHLCTLPHTEANSLGIDSIPFCFSIYSGKIYPLTRSISNIGEGGSQGMPCFSATKMRGGLDRCPSFMNFYSLHLSNFNGCFKYSLC